MQARQRFRVLVACEFSGIVRDAFARLGHDAWSCDLLESERPGNHLVGDAIEAIAIIKPDILIAHPPCTYLCNSGVRWLRDGACDFVPDRWRLMKEGSAFFYSLWDSDVPRIAIENPIPHCYGNLPRYSQIVQPWQFGHGETKATCLWLKGLPKLVPTNIVEGRKGRVHGESPGPDRWKNRSRTYEGIAAAMALQWGGDCK